MSETVSVPKVGKVKKSYLYAAGALVVGIVGYAWWTAGSHATAPAPAIDPETDVGAPDYRAPGGQSSAPVAVDGLEGVITTNDQWTRRAVELMSNIGFDAQFVAGALGKYLGRQPLTGLEKAAVQTARAMVGEPPLGGPYPMTDALPTPSPSGPPATPKTKPASPTGAHVRWGVPPGGKHRISITWSAAKGATSYRVYRDRKVVGTVTKPSFTEVLAPRSVHYYQIQSVNSAGTNFGATFRVVAPPR